jgi:hypothetical protein
MINIIKAATPHEVEISNLIPAKHSHNFPPHSLLKPAHLSEKNVWAVPIDIVARWFFTPPRLKKRLSRKCFHNTFYNDYGVVKVSK